ncbi:SpoIIE family protein phosphatase [Desulfosarcina ovata]|uniref:IcfG protein n=1 Tax=Desulfosarcina ovata subsp. ovata TaxID=2752305 RepID=A0A5K8AHL4_9BACT|nr:SpoIIE family protein phosphatase [Desulfosarcina ovata]BBO91334.1 IcfG protein [Desulfosarcina ovata subsp. ovata]
MIRKRGISFKLAASVLAGSLLVFLAIFAAGYIHSKSAITRNVEKNAENLALRIAHQIASVLAPVEKLPDHLAAVLESVDLDEGQMTGILRRALETSPVVFGTAIAFAPYAHDPATIDDCLYLLRREKAIHVTHLGGAQYNYFYQDWYLIPRETGKPFWSEPYFDTGGGNILMATYARPFCCNKADAQRFAGVVTADISLQWLEKSVCETPVLNSGYAFILSSSGTFITHPQQRWVMNETIFSIAESRQDTDLRRLGKRMIHGESGFVSFTGDPSGRLGFLYFAPIGLSHWSVGVFFPESELMADLNAFRDQGLFLLACGILLLILIVWLVAGTITRPLRTLSAAARQMATGDLTVAIPGLNSGGEVGALAESFAYMKDALNEHIRELVDTTAAKERIESELNIAHEIQMGLLPKLFPPFPDISGFDLFAMIQPAREVGGDLYDFYRMDDTRVCFVVGDVSGKGVPASLFMAVTMTLTKMTAAKRRHPGQILKEVNAQLSQDNAACMFVTLFCGVLDIRSGELWYANGGHNPPVLLRKNEAPIFLEGTDGVLLGTLPDLEYAERRIVLAPGDGLFIYTDGITEAMDASGELYAEERLLGQLSGKDRLSPGQIIESVMQDVNAFAGSAPQADDITMMMVRLR